MDCPVCLEPKNNFIYFRCAHHVCAECSGRMIEFNHTECPMCRVRIKEPMPEQTPEPMPQTPEPMPQTPEPRNFNECMNDDRNAAVAFGLLALGAIISCVAGNML